MSLSRSHDFKAAGGSMDRPDVGGPSSGSPVGDHLHRHEGRVSPALMASKRGIWALKWSVAGLTVTAAVQAVVVAFTGSVALLADTIHNIGDALTAVPLAVAFLLARLPASTRYPYGLGRSEDLAGLIVVGVILLSAAVAAWQSIDRLIDPRAPTALLAVAGAGVIGFVGNEAVAVFRIRVGREIGSAALVADGQHARVDGLTSLAVVLGAAGVALGAPVADPVVGLAITMVILRIAWSSARAVLRRMMDGVEPDIGERIGVVAAGEDGVESVGDVRARWVGHRLRAELTIEVVGDLPVREGHLVAERARQRLMSKVDHLDEAIVHVHPVGHRHR